MLAQPLFLGASRVWHWRFRPRSGGGVRHVSVKEAWKSLTMRCRRVRRCLLPTIALLMRSLAAPRGRALKISENWFMPVRILKSPARRKSRGALKCWVWNLSRARCGFAGRMP